MIWIVVPAVANIPEPWLIPEANNTVHKDARVEYPSEKYKGTI
jgi:hypothetical protein